ncbi:MAG TPA: hypothetical protein VMI54_09075 [Polyangiaceae bacterium]|nr:hypothetical protein [Polyangiaceae bacterium]
MSRRRTLVPRDQAVSTFSATLLRLCETTGAAGAALVDQQGETVDYAGYLEPFVLKVMAAEWRIVLDYARSVKLQGFDRVHEFVVRARKRSFALVALAEGYALVLELPRGAFSFSRRAVGEAVRELELEAGLPSSTVTSDGERWSKLEVQTAPGDRRRPQAVWFQGSWRPVTILGRYHVDSRRRGRAVGYRARLPTGHEFALVREPMGLWFAGDLTGFEPVPR